MLKCLPCAPRVLVSCIVSASATVRAAGEQLARALGSAARHTTPTTRIHSDCRDMTGVDDAAPRGRTPPKKQNFRALFTMWETKEADPSVAPDALACRVCPDCMLWPPARRAIPHPHTAMQAPRPPERGPRCTQPPQRPPCGASKTSTSLLRQRRGRTTVARSRPLCSDLSRMCSARAGPGASRRHQWTLRTRFAPAHWLGLECLSVGPLRFGSAFVVLLCSVARCQSEGPWRNSGGAVQAGSSHDGGPSPGERCGTPRCVPLHRCCAVVHPAPSWAQE